MCYTYVTHVLRATPVFHVCNTRVVLHTCYTCVTHVLCYIRVTRVLHVCNTRVLHVCNTPVAGAAILGSYAHAVRCCRIRQLSLQSRNDRSTLERMAYYEHCTGHLHGFERQSSRCMTICTDSNHKEATSDGSTATLRAAPHSHERGSTATARSKLTAETMVVPMVTVV